MFKKLILIFLMIITIEAKYLSFAGKNVVIDTSTSLMWQDGIFTYKSWKDAISYCESSTINDFDDWYLPNINELFSIVDLTHVNTAINDIFKGKVQSSADQQDKEKFWSSTNINNNDKVTNAYYINFALGTIESNAVIANTYPVRCVRRIF